MAIVYTSARVVFCAIELATLGIEMRQKFLDRIGWWLVATVLLGALLVRWVWVFFAPHSVMVIPAARISSAGAAEKIFGSAAKSPSVSEVSRANLRLVGLFSGKPGFALFELEGKRQVAATLGDDLAGSGKVVELGMDYAVIESGGVPQKISLEGGSPANKSVTAGSIPTSQ